MSLFRTCARCVLHNVSRAAPAPHQGVTCPGSLRLWSSASSQQARGSYIPLSLALFVPSAVTGCLAYWQYERSIWKENLIKSRAEMLETPAQNVFELKDLQESQKVSASGRFVHSRSIFVGPRPRSLPGLGVQTGYFLITPLYDPVRKGAVLVNRGWVPSNWNEDNLEKVESAWDARPQLPDPGSQEQQSEAHPGGGAPSSSAAQPEEKRRWFSRGRSKASTEASTAPAGTSQTKPPTVHVVGMLQPSEQPSAVIPDNVPENLEFHWVDVPTLARTMGLPADTPLVQRISEDPASKQELHKGNPMQQAREASFSSPNDIVFPIPKNSGDLVTFYTMPNDHLIYCGIWSSLCVGLALMARHVVRSPPRFSRVIDQGNEVAWKNTRSSQ